MLKVSELKARLGGAEVLRGISLDVAAGEVVCLIGANGAGKTTLLRTLAGSVTSLSGVTLLGGRSLQGLGATQRVRHGLALVPEGRQVFAPLSVLENLKMGAYTRPANEFQESLAQVLELFPILRLRMAQAAGTLSGGEQQMLAIGRALMSRPKLLLLDEPSLGVAPKVVSEIFAKLGKLAQQGLAVLLAEQNASIALAAASRGYVIAEGKVVLSDDTARLSSNPEVRRAYLGV